MSSWKCKLFWMITLVVNATTPLPVAASAGAVPVRKPVKTDPLKQVSQQSVDIQKILQAIGQPKDPCKSEAAKNPKLKWDPSWGEIGPKDYAVTAIAAGTSAAMFFAVEPPKNAHWKGSNALDSTIAKEMTFDSQSARNTANDVSDYLVNGLVGYSLVDGPAVALLNRDKKLAKNIFIVNAETMLVNEAVMLVISKLVARERPQEATCATTANGKLMDHHDPHCVRSFYSGHTANAFAAAGIICSTHETFELYGGGYKDKAACISSIGAAAAVGALRIASGNHHATDVLAGAAIGYAIGYLLPNILHYNFGKRSDAKSNRNWGTLLPVIAPESNDGTGQSGIYAGAQYRLTW